MVEVSRKTYDVWENGTWRYPLVLGAPHAGRAFPDGFVEESPLTYEALMATADLNTEKLACVEGVRAIHALFARSFVDLNRSRQQLDPAIIEGLPPTKDLQILSGYGVLPRFAANKNLTMRGKLTFEMAEARLVEFYDPYHTRLEGILREVRGKFGYALLIDVHSAPSGIMGGRDAILGTCFGKSISPVRLADIEAAFEGAGISTIRDVPFSGGYITQHYHGMVNIDVLQVEISRDLLDEGNFEIFFPKWQKALKAILKRL